MAIDKASQKFIRKFGLRLREVREKKGWTLERAEQMGYPHWQHLQQIESGRKNISLNTILKLSKLYRVSISELFRDL